MRAVRTGFGQREAARSAVDQALADARLEALQCLGHGRAGNAELAGGAGERAGFGDFGEDRPALEIRKGHAHPQKWKACLSILSVFGVWVEDHLPAFEALDQMGQLLRR